MLHLMREQLLVLQHHSTGNMGDIYVLVSYIWHGSDEDCINKMYSIFARSNGT